MKKNVFLLLSLLLTTTIVAVPARRSMSPSPLLKKLPSVRTFTPRVLVIMTSFQNYNFVNTKADVDSMFNAQNWTKNDAKGSVRQYFRDQSQGLYAPQFDIVGPVTLPQTYAYYGANSGKNTSPRAGEMIVDACMLVNDSVDFSQYDSNSDGKVDLVFVLYAGFGENDPPEHVDSIRSTDLIWPHYNTTTSAAIFDGKSICAYECSNELDGLYSYNPRGTNAPVMVGIGVLVHEFCHSLGLPDMYNSNNEKAFKTLGEWSVLDHGCYNDDMHSPAALTAYERWYLGWLSPEPLNDPENVTLRPLSEYPDARYFTMDSTEIPDILHPTTNPFYLLENRQLKGWDRGIPGTGLLLYRIQYDSSRWKANTVNTDSSQMGVDILEADGLWRTINYGYSGFYGKRGDCYPYGVLDSITIVPNLPITHICQQRDGSVSFCVCGGIPSVLPETRVNAPAQKVLYRDHLYLRRGNTLYDLTGHKVN